ncbi:MAG: hypothetical protein IMZ52_07645 [Actinobacteria bacterium]|nr:hypothetical protein [Actinomycetota bacterium]MBE3114600.1 hypothetical protein [Actinomycetota bacterium]
MQYNIEVSGIDKVLANLTKLESVIQSNIKPGLIGASDKLRDSAIGNLANSKWPPSVDDLSIRDKTSWDTIDGGMNAIILECQSQHALAVEKGTFASPKLGADGRFHSAELTQTGGPFPVGKSQGILVRFATSIAPQQPKNYLTGAMNNPTTMNAMITEVGNVLNRAIMTVGV